MNGRAAFPFFFNDCCGFILYHTDSLRSAEVAFSLQALIEFPSLFRFLQVDQAMHEVVVDNERLHNRLIRELSFLEDALVIRVFRKNDVIIPHGDTQIKLGDILLISASHELIDSIRRQCR